MLLLVAGLTFNVEEDESFSEDTTGLLCESEKRGLLRKEAGAVKFADTLRCFDNLDGLPEL
jgi:hypothetical protein